MVLSIGSVPNRIEKLTISADALLPPFCQLYRKAGDDHES